MKLQIAAGKADPIRAKVARHSRAPKKIRPVTVTIKDDLAERLREFANCLGWRASSQAKQAISFGLLMIETTPEAEAYRIEMALHALQKSGRRFVEVVER